MTINVEKDPKATLAQEATALCTTAKEYAITTSDEANNASSFITQVKLMKTKVDATFKPLHESAKATAADIKATWDSIGKPLEEAKNHVQAMIGAFIIAEQKRVNEENAKRLLEAKKQEETTAELFGEEGIAPAPIAFVAAPVVAGVYSTTTWSAEVIDLLTLVKAVAEGKAPLEYLCANGPALNEEARKHKAELAIPGVKAVSKTDTRKRG